MAKDNALFPSSASSQRQNAPGTRLLFGLVVIYCVTEGFLQLSDFGLIGPERLRFLAYEYGGFWPGLLDNWTANYVAQPVLMFLTYSFLHSGLIHLAANMLTLWSLGQAVMGRVQTRGFILLYVLSTLGGAVGYAILSEGLRPMVGASGALFGLAGGILAWVYVDRFTYSKGLLPILQAVVLLVLLNLVLWWAMKGQLAWETHLGGFVTGWISALLIDPRAQEGETG